MKSILIVLMSVILVVNVSRAQDRIQTAPWCGDCCNESFLYEFCDQTGASYVKCSANPNSEHDPAIKQFIPDHVCVGQMPAGTDAMWQPTGPPIQPASLVGSQQLNNDPDEIAGATSQQSSDADLFLSIPGQPPVAPTSVTDPGAEPTDNCGTEPKDNCGAKPTDDCGTAPDPNDYADGVNDPDYQAALDTWNTCESTYSDDLSAWQKCDDDYNSAKSDWQTCESDFQDADATWKGNEKSYKEYLGANIQYQADLAAWNNNINDFVQVFDPNQATIDANNALNNWKNLCSPPLTACKSDCCIQVVFDDNRRDFGADPTILATTSQSATGTFGVCQASQCSNDIIRVNISPQALDYQRLDGLSGVPNPTAYTLHTVHLTEFYTGQGPTHTLPGYNAYSFYQIMEHEIGHYLGMHHPDEELPDGSKCDNCYNRNPYANGVTHNPNAYRTVMASDNTDPVEGENQALPLSDEDICQFKKLYCNSCAPGNQGANPCQFASVALEDQESHNASIRPNPSSGYPKLFYTLAGPEQVSIQVYNETGILVANRFSGFQSAGSKEIDLDVNSLPSGNYICRLRVQNTVEYINFVVRK